MTTPAFDWRHAKVGDPQPCALCGQPALMRHPDTQKPTHKVCAETRTTTTGGTP